MSRWIRAGENLLVVRVESPKDTNVKVGPNEKTLVKGALQDWDCNNLDVNPGGIFADVRLIESRAIAIERVKATPYVDAEGRRARVHCKVTLVNPDPEIRQVTLSACVAPDNFEGPESGTEAEVRHLVPGASAHELWVEVAEPRLWWPWDMGEQHLYRFTVTAGGGEDGGVLDEVSDRIGLRHLRQVPGTWECYVNGKRIFCRGPNYLSEQLQSNMTREKYAADVRLMREANMNMVRVYCVVEREEFYDVCDEMGMLVLQDFPAQGALSNSSDLVRRAVPQARDMVNQLYHHPSIIIWALGEQPSIENFEKLCQALVTAAGEEDSSRFLQQGACVLGMGDRQEQVRLADRLPPAVRLVPARHELPDQAVPHPARLRGAGGQLGGGPGAQETRPAGVSSASSDRPSRCRTWSRCAGSSRTGNCGRWTGRRWSGAACTARSCCAGSPSRRAWSS